MSDFSAYYTWMQWLLEGQIPYVDFHVDYPIGFWIPVFISTIISNNLTNIELFISSFRIFMIICDAITAICVYIIALKLYDEKTACRSVVLYIFAFSTIHYVFWKFDSFPVMLLVLSITAAIYGRETSSYFLSIFGFFTKMFPIISFPFILLYNKSIYKISQLLLVSIFIVVMITTQYFFFGVESLGVFRSGIGARDYIYATTFWYAIGSIFEHTIEPNIISLPLMVLSVVAISWMIYIFWKSERSTDKLLVCIIISTFIASFSNTHYSPQFSIWITPFLSVLLAKTVYDVLIFFIYQIIGYISYPTLFDRLYNNNRYLWESGYIEHNLITTFFIVQWVFYIGLMIYLYRKFIGVHMPSMSLPEDDFWY